MIDHLTDTNISKGVKGKKKIEETVICSDEALSYWPGALDTHVRPTVL
jgi:hypothetical protein